MLSPSFDSILVLSLVDASLFGSIIASISSVSSGSSSPATSKTSPPNSSSPPKSRSSVSFFFSFFPDFALFPNVPSPSSNKLSPPSASRASLAAFSLVASASLSTSICLSIESIFSITSRMNASAAFLNPTLGCRSSGLAPSTPVRGHVNPFFASPSLMQDSQVGLPSGSHGTSIASRTTEPQMPHRKCSGTDVAVSLRA
mmetsp:Transcript_33530/g.81052  ORF Transcript_33530/g.81052 Transcript_33530/m.81052 type:complete len:200 (-) Transcript_33530:643-1242(-)